MNDALIRASFHRQVLKRHRTSGQTLILDELGLRHGRCRADIAVINGSLTGYEIKSDADSLRRLREQIKAYSAVFDRAAVITGTRHLEAVLSELPGCWGLIVCHQARRGGVRFETWRAASRNAGVDPVAIAQLLWKPEAAGVLKGLGEPPSILRQRRAVLYERLAQLLSLDQLRRRVSRCLKQRRNWRRPEPLSLSGG